LNKVRLFLITLTKIFVSTFFFSWFNC
jgi:hypothetical protein